jgi:hypothetical protein
VCDVNFLYESDAEKKDRESNDSVKHGAYITERKKILVERKADFNEL